ncbi:hypothetical protein GCM10010140_14180 [Streptosporangium pseudovulgare]|uniref:Uncharacterized protein n=1 Tax=Streptosporangium pseudovulgare TaxID=35765 RepID=A0ABQ2QKE0_9ACTN|nr:hypothetical protein GCM10010140_14180 [Streptosporangium pseudovulgare]
MPLEITRPARDVSRVPDRRVFGLLAASPFDVFRAVLPVVFLAVLPVSFDVEAVSRPPPDRGRGAALAVGRVPEDVPVVAEVPGEAAGEGETRGLTSSAAAEAFGVGVPEEGFSEGEARTSGAASPGPPVCRGVKTADADAREA